MLGCLGWFCLMIFWSSLDDFLLFSSFLDSPVFRGSEKHHSFLNHKSEKGTFIKDPIGMVCASKIKDWLTAIIIHAIKELQVMPFKRKRKLKRQKSQFNSLWPPLTIYKKLQKICTWESSIGWVAKKAPSSRGIIGSPSSSSSSTTDGFTDSGVLSLTEWDNRLQLLDSQVSLFITET